MPSIRVTLNEQCLAEVDVTGLDVLAVRVSGDRVGEAFAELDMTGGAYPKGGDSTFLTWIASVPLNESDRVQVVFKESGATTHAGKTIGELFPDEPEDADEPNILDSLPQVIEELRAGPAVRDGHRFALELPRADRYEGTTKDMEHGFGFSVLWNSQSPQRVSVSLHTYTLDDLVSRGPMHDHVYARLGPDNAVVLQVSALDAEH